MTAKRLEELRREAKAEARASKARNEKERARKPKPKRYRARFPLTWTRVGITTAKVVAIILLPFFVYVRASVLFYNRFGWSPWLAVGGAVTLVLLLVAGYATWLATHVASGTRIRSVARTIAVPLAAAFIGYSLLFLARVNAKTDDVQSFYNSLHPVLRAAVSVAIIIDRNAVITDMQRTAADYPRMGLPVNSRTRHYLQADGWVHAVDIRTNGRSAVRNGLLQFYFWGMGFSTLRHVGTSDHLHVQLF